MRHAAFCAALVAGAILSAPLVAALSPHSALADDKDDRKKDEKRKKREQERVAVLKAIGAEFADKDVGALLGRVAKGSKISLDVGKGGEGQYSVDQAKGVLRQYFGKFEEITVAFSKVDDNVGEFKMTVRLNGEDAAKPRTLHVTIDGPDSNGTITLTKLIVSGA